MKSTKDSLRSRSWSHRDKAGGRTRASRLDRPGGRPSRHPREPRKSSYAAGGRVVPETRPLLSLAALRGGIAGVNLLGGETMIGSNVEVAITAATTWSPPR